MDKKFPIGPDINSIFKFKYELEQKYYIPQV